MAKRYLNTIVSRLKTSNPNNHVNPSNGSSTAEPLRPTFAFLNISSAKALVVVVLPAKVSNLEVAATCLEDKAFRKARTKITMLI